MAGRVGGLRSGWLVMVRRLVFLLAVLVVVLVVSGCPKTVEPAVARVVIDEGDQALVVGDSVQLSVSVEAVGGASEAVVWGSDPAGVVSVDEDGLVVAVAAGVTVVTATSAFDQSKSASVTVTVVVAPVVSVSIHQGDLQLEVGRTVALRVTVEAVGAASRAVVWSSDDPGVALVGVEGVVTAVSEGAAVITATSVVDDRAHDSVTVTVVPCPSGGVYIEDAERPPLDRASDMATILVVFGDDPDAEPQEVTVDVVDGHAIFQGDIILGRMDEISRLGMVHVQSSRVWPDAGIPYVIDADLTETMKQRIAAAIEHWEANTPIRLIPRAELGIGDEVDYVWFFPSDMCASWVGKEYGPQVIWLSELCTVGNIIHEVGHAVGLHHEHSRHDQEDHVEILWDNIEDGKERHFETIADSRGTDVGTYDFDSVMHYPRRAFGRRDDDGFRMETIVTKPPGIRIGQREGLSPGDIAAVRALYGPPDIQTFTVTPEEGLVGESFVFTWAVDVDAWRVPDLRCRLDVDGDGVANYTLTGTDCHGTHTLTHWYPHAGRYQATLSVDYSVVSVLVAQETATITVGEVNVVYTLVRDAVTGQPLGDIMVDVCDATGICSSVDVFNISHIVGYYSFRLPEGDGYAITFRRRGYLDATYHDVSVTLGEDTYLEQLLLIDEAYDEPARASGLVLDAFSGDGVPGAAVALRTGYGSVSGPTVAVTTTDAFGEYEFSNLDAGYYGAQVTRSGYVSAGFSLAVVGGRENINYFSITPDLAVDEFRLVLTWGVDPPDLDSHMTGPRVDHPTERFHVWYFARTYAHEGRTHVQLDRDVTSSYGPETITIYEQTPGSYRYSVHDFTNQASTTSTALARSGAQVSVYHGTRLIRTFYVPPYPGTLWTVLELQGSTLTPVNAMSFVSDPSDVRRAGIVTDTDLLRELPPK